METTTARRRIAPSPDTVGKSTAITVISAMPWYWALWVRLNFWRIRSRHRAGKGASSIERRLWELSFIHFAHWGVFERIPPSGSRLRARWLRHPYLLFHSNFNGSAWEYIEAFAVVIKWGMRAIWGGAYGAPPPVPVAPFIDYIREQKIETSYYYCAYPQASTRMIRTALATRELFRQLRRDTAGLDAKGFESEYWKAVKELERPSPGDARLGESDGLCVLTPISQGQEKALAADLEALRAREQSPFADIAGTHFARFVLVPHLKLRRGRKLYSTSYLLFAAEFDGPPERYAGALCEPAASRAGRLWSRHCEECPDISDRAAFRRYLLEHRVKAGYSVLGYPDATLSDVLNSLELRRRLEEFFLRAQYLTAEELKSAFESDLLENQA